MARSKSRLFVEGVAARHEGAGIVGIDPDCGIEIGDGAVHVVLRQPHAAAIGVCPRIVGIELDRFREIAERAGKVALGAHRHAAIVMQDGEIGRLIAAGIDQRRAGGDSLVVGGAPLPGAAALVRAVLGARPATAKARNAARASAAREGRTGQNAEVS